MKRMISRILLFVLFSVSITGSFAKPQVPSDQTYSLAGDPEGFASPAEAKAVVDEIMNVVGKKATFEVRAARIPNAAAATLKGKRYILYNPAFMAAIHKVTGSNRWVPISILAHEIGHHLYGHTIKGTASEPARTEERA